MWSQGLDYGDRERALSAMFALSPEAPGLFRRYGVEYVVIGPDERERSIASLAAYHARFPRLLRTQSYEIFAVCQGAPCHLEAAAPTGAKAVMHPADIRRRWSQRCKEAVAAGEQERWASAGGIFRIASRPGGETGRRMGLKIPWGQPRPGSNPGPGMLNRCNGLGTPLQSV